MRDKVRLDKLRPVSGLEAHRLHGVQARVTPGGFGADADAAVSFPGLGCVPKMSGTGRTVGHHGRPRDYRARVGNALQLMAALPIS